LTRQNKLIALIAYLLVLTVCMLVYRSNRTTKIKRLRADLARITAEQDRTRAAETEVTRLTRLIPAEANTPAFIEALYRSARESGLKQHEVSTESDKSSGTARPGGTDTATIAKHRLKISTTGSYRNFAEYLRRLQNTERFNRITDFKLTPDTAQLKGSLTVELYSLPVKQ
jgi:Tfp pilus assembly protein PilO